MYRLSARKVALGLSRQFSSNAGPASSGGNGGLVLFSTAGLAGIGGAAYYADQNPSFKESSDQVPGLTKTLELTADLMRTVGITGDSQQKTSLLDPPKSGDNNNALEKVNAENDAENAKMKAKKDEAVMKRQQAEKKAAADEAALKENEQAQKEAADKAKKEKMDAINKKEAEKAAAIELAKEKEIAEEVAAKARAEAEAETKKAEEEKKPITEKLTVKPTEIDSKNKFAQLPTVSSEEQVLSESNQIQTNNYSNQASNMITEKSIQLQKELEANLLSDIHELNENELRIRLTQLAAEFFERTKWEGVRIHQSIKQVENDLNLHYYNLLKKQRTELEMECNKLLLSKEQDIIAKTYINAQEQVNSHEKYYNDSIRKLEKKYQNDINNELKSQEFVLSNEYQNSLNNEIANLRNVHVQEQLKIQSKISDLNSKIAGFDEATLEISGLNDDSANAHKLSASILTLQSNLYGYSNSSSNKSLYNDIKNIKKYSNNDPVVDAIVKSLPNELIVEGTSNMDELKLRFSILKDELRKVAMAPEGVPPVVGQFVGSILAKFYWAPIGPVQGDGEEEIISRANHYIKNNDIKNTIKELNVLCNNNKVHKSLSNDWIKKAENRLIADQAVKALTSHTINKHMGFGTKTSAPTLD
jgi:hypothetical protein